MELNIDYIGLAYAVLVLLGGVVGFIKAGSGMSLAAGLISGVIAGYGALTSNFYVLAGVAVVLGGVMAFRFYKSGNFMPPGLVLVLSVILLGRCIFAFVQQARA
ncbi:unnamed protein product [Bursaphelenchus xylophilus]|uniref:(pine wood nematode) hypothetical protein n=1 Tax=Bursaphelenchus xylophilus TaxID=6326 RepID=A0A1I7S125_BURXY|nr:unnamed protein product [Bursaphelenchus xylophilus]CAG9079874.1 unnamed protein product [Bursaphelenchus xylophilus]